MCWSITRIPPTAFASCSKTVRHAVRGREGALVRTVFGAVGLRDIEKARQSGELVGALSDRLILTTGSAPRDQRMLRLAELRSAAAGKVDVEVVLERRGAIERAIFAARPGDVVTVLGLGALKRQVLDAAGTLAPNDDRQIVRDVLSRLGAPSWS